MLVCRFDIVCRHTLTQTNNIQDHKPVRVKDTFNHSLKGPDNVLFYPNGQLFMIYQKLYQIKLFLSSRSGMMNGCPVDQAGRLLAVCTRCNNGCRFWTPFLFCKKESRDRKASVFHLYSYSGALKGYALELPAWCGNRNDQSVGAHSLSRWR